MTETLREYINRRLKEKGMSGRAAAAAMGISHSYFFNVATGKIKRPGADFCRKLAKVFGDSPIEVLRIAGWLPYDADDKALLEELRDLAKDDPGFIELARMYRQLESPQARRMFVALTKAALEVIRQEQEREQEE